VEISDVFDFFEGLAPILFAWIAAAGILHMIEPEHNPAQK
jgi:hypothetical protein